MFYDQIMESAAYIRGRIAQEPSIGVVLGSGLGALVDVMEDKEVIPYTEIPHFPQSHVEGHAGNLVLGSTANRTASLAEDDHGLHGPVEINENDQDAKNAYARVERGDVRGCSFGFDIRGQEEWWDDNGTYRTRLTDVELYEVSPCSFPAYTQTSIQARAREELDSAKMRFDKAKKEKSKTWRAEMRRRLKGD